MLHYAGLHYIIVLMAGFEIEFDCDKEYFRIANASARYK